MANTILEYLNEYTPFDKIQELNDYLFDLKVPQKRKQARVESFILDFRQHLNLREENFDKDMLTEADDRLLNSYRLIGEKSLIKNEIRSHCNVIKSMIDYYKNNVLEKVTPLLSEFPVELKLINSDFDDSLKKLYSWYSEYAIYWWLAQIYTAKVVYEGKTYDVETLVSGEIRLYPYKERDLYTLPIEAVIHHNLKVQLQKWLSINPVLTEEEFLEIKLVQEISSVEKAKIKMSTVVGEDSNETAYDYGIAKIRLSVIQDRLEKIRLGYSKKDQLPKIIRESDATDIVSFKEAFIDKKQYQIAIEALKKLRLIGAENENLIGKKLKGVIQVWISVLRNDKRQLKAIHDKHLTILLNREFKNLRLSEKTDGKHLRNPLNQAANENYRQDFIDMI